MSRQPFFASQSFSEHLLRGVLGIVFFALAIAIATEFPVISLSLGALAIFVFRGCPVCWLIGLIETRQLKHAVPEQRHKRR